VSALLRGRAADGVRAVLADLSTRYLRLRPSAMPDGSLANGAAGLALVYDALERTFPGLGHRRRGDQALRRATSLLREREHDAGLFHGFTGTAWTVEHLVGARRAAGEPDLCATVDAALEEYLGQDRSRAPFDVIEGLVGIGVYALERWPRGSAGRMVARLVECLRDGAQAREVGVAWRSRRVWLAARFRKDHRDWNLGLAHGTPGVIAFLSAVVAGGFPARTKSMARRLLEKAVEWVLSHDLNHPGGAFPYAAGERQPSRQAWCYGDPSVAIALLLAADAVKEPQWRRHATRVALAAAARPPESAGTFDCGLCHGTAGLGHLYHRLYRLTGEERLAVTAREWFARTVASRKKGRGFCGYLAFAPLPGTQRQGWRADPGFLVGAGGLTLALISALKDTSAWDRPLLTASPPWARTDTATAAGR
jgi:hypothetical protein